MLIDLSVTLNQDTPVYPGDPEIKIKQAGALDSDGFWDHEVTVGTHVGTHMDAPSHMLPNAKNLDQVGIDQFTGRGVCIPVKGDFSLDAVQSADIRKGDIVLFSTGWDKRFADPAYFEDFPQITEEVANYLVEKHVNIVGTDTCSPDKPPFQIHKIFLSHEILIIENLTNLDQLVGKEFKVYAFPVKLDVDAAPVRVVADVP